MHTSFNNLDFVILAIVLISGLLALTRGFVSEVFSLIAWVGAYFAAVKFYPLAEPWVHRYIHNPGAAAVIAAFALFFVALVLLSVIGNSFSDIIKASPLTSVDRSLGFVFGVLRGLLVVCLVYLCVVTILWPEIEKIDEKTPPLKITETKVTETKTVDRKGAETTRTEKTEETNNSAPEWLLHARFRPALVYGSNILKSFIPQGLVDKTKQEYYKGKDKIEVMIDEHKPGMIKPPVPSEKPSEKASERRMEKEIDKREVTAPVTPEEPSHETPAPEIEQKGR